MITKGQGIFMICLLLLVVIAFITIEQSFESSNDAKSSAPVYAASGFLDYDLIPAELKHKMYGLQAGNQNIKYSYWYFFDIEEVNKHYYLEDGELEIVESLPVTNPEALAMVDERIQNNPGIDRFTARHPDMSISPASTKEDREKQYKKFLENKDKPSWVWIQYLFPEDTVDFSKLRVGIVEQTYTNSAAFAVTHSYDEVDTLPEPIRGYDYFEEVMIKELMEHDVFTFYDLKGKVTIEFTVGKAPSPNIVEGFSTREDSYEAYKADGAFIKALNSLKVRWKPGKQGNSQVAVRMPLTFYVDGQTIKLKKVPDAIADL